MATLYDIFTVTFGKEKDRRIAELETQLDERTTGFRTFKDGVVIALGDAAPSADDSSAENIAAGVLSLHSQVEDLTNKLAPFREYVVAHAEPEAPEARDGEDGGGEAGQAPDQVDPRPRDESGRFTGADDLDPAPAVDDPAPAVEPGT